MNLIPSPPARVELVLAARLNPHEDRSQTRGLENTEKLRLDAVGPGEDREGNLEAAIDDGPGKGHRVFEAFPAGSDELIVEKLHLHTRVTGSKFLHLPENTVGTPAPPAGSSLGAIEGGNRAEGTVGIAPAGPGHVQGSAHLEDPFRMVAYRPRQGIEIVREGAGLVSSDSASRPETDSLHSLKITG